jgi:hypothetical protein
MIAAVAWWRQATLLARDADPAHVALVAGIEPDESSQQG